MASDVLIQVRFWGSDHYIRRFGEAILRNSADPEAYVERLFDPFEEVSKAPLRSQLLQGSMASNHPDMVDGDEDVPAGLDHFDDWPVEDVPDAVGQRGAVRYAEWMMRHGFDEIANLQAYIGKSRLRFVARFMSAYPIETTRTYMMQRSNVLPEFEWEKEDVEGYVAHHLWMQPDTRQVFRRWIDDQLMYYTELLPEDPEQVTPQDLSACLARDPDTFGHAWHSGRIVPHDLLKRTPIAP